MGSCTKKCSEYLILVSYDVGLFSLCSNKKFKNILPSYPIFHAWVVCFVVLVTITTISIRFIKKVPYFAVGWFWYLGTLVPVIGIVQVGGQAMADRYAYVPLKVIH